MFFFQHALIPSLSSDGHHAVEKTVSEIGKSHQSDRSKIIHRFQSFQSFISSFCSDGRATKSAPVPSRR